MSENLQSWLAVDQMWCKELKKGSIYRTSRDVGALWRALWFCVKFIRTEGNLDLCRSVFEKKLLICCENFHSIRGGWVFLSGNSRTLKRSDSLNAAAIAMSKHATRVRKTEKRRTRKFSYFLPVGIPSTSHPATSFNDFLTFPPTHGKVGIQWEGRINPRILNQKAASD